MRALNLKNEFSQLKLNGSSFYGSYLKLLSASVTIFIRLLSPEHLTLSSLSLLPHQFNIYIFSIF